MRLAALPLNDELIRFFDRHRTFEEGWRACRRPDWLVELALHGGVDRRIIVVLSVPVVERALAHHSFQLGIPEMARRWARKEAEGAEAWAAGFRAVEEAKKHRGPQAAALRSAAALAFACDATSSPSYYAIRGHLVDAVVAALESLPDEAAAFADALRRGLPLAALAKELAAQIERNRPPTRETGERPKKPYSWRPPLAAADDD